MDRQAQEYAAAMAFAQQQQQQANMQQQPFGFQQQPQQYPHQAHGPPFLPHPSVQQFPPYQHHLPPQQLYPHQGQFLHPQPQQLPPHAFAPHHPPYHMSPGYMHPMDSAPPPVAPPPSDPELQKRIDKLIEYVVKNGPQFEAMVREKEQENPDYSFLFGAEGHNYYRYKLWLSTRPAAALNQSFQPTSATMMPSSHSPLGNSPSVSPSLGAGAPGPMFGAPPVHQPPYPPPLYDQQQQQPPFSQTFMGHSRADYEPTAKPFKGLSGPLPSDVAAELNNVLANLTGTKESIKGAKMWFMQRSPFAPALAQSLRERIFTLDDPERQLHIIYLANDILFDSLQRRMNPQELDNEALAFRPVLGSMLARIYHNPHNKESNQSRLEKIIQFWASKEVYNQETISSLEREMTGGLPLRSLPLKDSAIGMDYSNLTGLQQTPHNLANVQSSALGGSVNQQDPQNPFPPASVPPQFLPNQMGGLFPSVAQAPFQASLPIQHPISAAGQPSVPNFQPNPTAGNVDQTPPPYPLFPPGLIPGMVRKMQVGSGVPYSPLSPLDIPTVIPPSTVSHSDILERVNKFFKEIGEVNPSVGPIHGSDSNDEDDGYEREPDVRKGGACIPPPPALQVNPETGMAADGSFDHKPGSSSSGRLGLGAAANPNEVSQYDDVYSSYRKQQSTSYHSSMSSRATTR